MYENSTQIDIKSERKKYLIIIFFLEIIALLAIGNANWGENLDFNSLVIGWFFVIITIIYGFRKRLDIRERNSCRKDQANNNLSGKDATWQIGNTDRWFIFKKYIPIVFMLFGVIIVTLWYVYTFFALGVRIDLFSYDIHDVVAFLENDILFNSLLLCPLIVCSGMVLNFFLTTNIKWDWFVLVFTFSTIIISIQLVCMLVTIIWVFY